MNHFPWIIDPNQLFLKSSHFRKRRQAAVQAQGRIDTVNEYLKQKAEEKAEAEAEEQAAYDAQKQAYKDSADVVIEGTIDGDKITNDGAINPSNGKPVNFFVDGKGVAEPGNSPYWGGGYDFIKTADGNDVIYAPGMSFVYSKGGDDIIFMEDAFVPEYANKYECFSEAHAGDGSDQIYAENGNTHAFGGEGDDLIDLGNGWDTATGGRGADEFVVDLQNTGCDLICDFLDVGDKISIKNGGKDAVSGEWFFKEFSTDGDPWHSFFSHPDSKALSMGDSFADFPEEEWLLGYGSTNHTVLAIQNSNAEIAAFVFVGAGVGPEDQAYHKELGKFDVVAEVSSSSIQITSAEYKDEYMMDTVATFTPEFA